MTTLALARSTLRDVIAAVQLEDVRLIDVAATTRIYTPKAVQNPQLVSTHGAKVLQRSENAFVVGARMLAKVVSKGDEATENAPVQFNVTFAIRYRLESADQYPQDVLDQFASVNAVFNVWPYWREYIQTTAARMNLPPTILPVFRLAFPPSDDRREAHSGSALPGEGGIPDVAKRTLSRSRTRRPARKVK